MHSTSTGPSLSERCGSLPCMPRPLQRLRVVFAPVLLHPAWEWPEQWWRFRPKQREAEMVATRFLRGLHACRGAGTHAGSQ